MDALTQLPGRTRLLANLVLAGVLTGILGLELGLTAHHPGNHQLGLAVSVVLGGLALVRERHRGWAVTGGLAVCAVAVVFSLTFGLPTEPGVASTAALLVLGASFVRTAPARRGGLVAVAGVLVLTAGRAELRASLILPVALLGVIAWSAALAVGFWLRSVDTVRSAALAAARRDERLELARELHDEVAHHVAAIVVQSQAVRLVAAGRPELLPDALTAIEVAGGDALIAMRRVVGLLRDGDGLPESTPSAGQLAELVRRFGSAGGWTVDLRLPEGEDGRTPRVRTAVYRVVQEALTNIARHASQARAVHVLVEVVTTGTGPAVRIEVTDDGPHPRLRWPSLHAGGYGLVGMRERVEVLGGHVEAGPGPARRWTVQATIPLNHPVR